MSDWQKDHFPTEWATGKKEEKDWHSEFVLIILFNYDEIDFDLLCLQSEEEN